MRQQAKEQRKAAEQIDRLKVKAEKELNERAERLKQAQLPIRTFDISVAGTQYGNRSSDVQQYCIEGNDVELIREPGNPYDPNAVLVALSAEVVFGYVPRRQAVDLAPLLDSGARYLAWVRKLYTGPTRDIPVVYVQIFGKDATIERLRLASSREFREDERSSPAVKSVGSAGCCLGLIAIPILVLGCLAMMFLLN